MPKSLPAVEDLPADAVDLEKTRLLFRNVGMAQTVTVINGGVLLFVLGGLNPPAWGLGWWVVVMLVSAARYELARRFLSGNPTPGAAPVWRRRALLGAHVAGWVWAGGGTAIMLADPDSARLFTALVTAGMVAGAVPILSSVPAAFRAYAAPVMLAIIVIALADAHGPRDWMLALVAALYLGALLRSARYFHDSLDQSIRLALHMRGMAQRLDKALHDAQAASAAKSQFLAVMSHEIRTPLNGILGMAQVLLMPGPTETERHDYARTILNSGQTLLTLLNDILDLSKVEAGKFELQPAVFAPDRLLVETAALFADLAREKGLALDTAWQGPPGRLYRSDPSRLRQMISNFINNAIKFTARGAVRVRGREIGHDAGGAVLEFSVEDSGIGIPAHQHEMLFQPFSQIDGSNTRQFGGSGLGLSIVRSLAQLMGGAVGVDSGAGKGSRFWFTIRAELADETERFAAAHGGNDAPMPPLRVLVAEDNAVNRSVITALLGRLGLHAECVANGREAVEAIEADMPNLVLMDVQMPVMDGIEACANIRANERMQGRARLPIVALTAGAFDDDRRRCLAAGMDDFLTKPIGLENLRITLDKWLTAAARPSPDAPPSAVAAVSSSPSCSNGGSRSPIS